MTQGTPPPQPAAKAADDPIPHSVQRTAGIESSKAFHESLRANEPLAQQDALSRLLFWRQAKTARGRGALRIVWGLLFSQFMFSVYIVGHGMFLISGMRTMIGDRATIVIGVLLLAGVLVSLHAVNVLIREIRGGDTARAITGGALARLIELHFNEWKLTNAERDVAMFTLKGFETQEIAELRHATQGTVRVQLSQIYGKAGVHTRCAFQSLFFEDLLDLSEEAHATEGALAEA
jgi:DNA-binding CsgD family transcriptional regulator